MDRFDGEELYLLNGDDGGEWWRQNICNNLDARDESLLMNYINALEAIKEQLEDLESDRDGGL